MAAKIERTYYARLEEFERLMKHKGHSLDSLAKAAPVSVVTLGRLLNRDKRKRRPGIMATFKKLADELDVTPDTLIEGRKPKNHPLTAPHDYQRIKIGLELAKEFNSFDETSEIAKFTAALQKIIGAKA